MLVLKITLWCCAFCCLIAFIFALLPWSAITYLFDFAGMQPPAAQQSTVYLFRLCFLFFGMIGVFFLILAFNPLKYGMMLLLAAYGLIVFAFYSFAAGLRYNLPAKVFWGDAIFGLLAGGLILIFRKRAKINNTPQV